MRHQRQGRKFNRDANARKALFIGLAKNLIEKEQIKTTLPKAKDLRSIVEKLITRSKVDNVANRRLVASELGNSSANAVKKLFTVLGPRYAARNGGYTRVLKAGFRYGDAAPMAVMELVDRDENAKKAAPVKEKADAKSDEKATAVKKEKPAVKSAAPKVARETKSVKATSEKKEVSVKRRATGK